MGQHSSPKCLAAGLPDVYGLLLKDEGGYTVVNIALSQFFFRFVASIEKKKEKEKIKFSQFKCKTYFL